MRTLSCTLAVIAVLGTAAPMFAGRPTCHELVTARASGQSSEDIARAHGTTQARVEACVRIEAQRQRLAQSRVRYHLMRAERGLEE
jgi:hypothetical protein